MAIIFSHISALEYLRSESAFVGLDERRSDQLTVHRFPPSKCDTFRKSAPSGRDALDQASCFHGYMSRPVHIMASSAASRCKTHDVICHVHGSRLPTGSLIRSNTDGFVCAPELCFIQMAQLLSFVDTIQLGFELCGTYAKGNAASEGVPARNPLTTPMHLRRYIERYHARSGTQRAVHALRYILPGSASPMETVLAMLLHLPKRYGGYGLPAPKLNYPVETTQTHFGERQARQRICDLIWPDKLVAVEYDSDLHHRDDQSIARDSIRRVELENANVSVVTVTRAQVFNLTRMDEVAGLLFKLLGVRFQKPSVHWRAEQRRLRDELIPHFH